MSMSRSEVRELVKSKLRDGMTADEAADVVAGLFHKVEDRWDTVDLTTFAERPGSQFIRQRTLILEAVVESARFRVVPDP